MDIERLVAAFGLSGHEAQALRHLLVARKSVDPIAEWALARRFLLSAIDAEIRQRRRSEARALREEIPAGGSETSSSEAPTLPGHPRARRRGRT